MPSNNLLFEVHGSLATISLNRPQKKNALSKEMWANLPAFFDQVTQDKSIRVIVLTGAGGSFAAGADISEFENTYATRESAAEYSSLIAEAMNAVADCPKPVIAKIDGACIGGGCGLALACDIRIASENSKFGITPGKLGLAYSLTDTRRIVDAVGVSMAKDILYTGRILEAGEAKSIGLIDFMVPQDELTDRVKHYADIISQNSSFSMQSTKAFMQKIARGQKTDDAESHQQFLDAFDAQDFKEGYTAFLAKRKPDFSKH